MTRLPRLLRLLHSGGRQVPHPNQGGAGAAASVSASTVNLPPPSLTPSAADLTPDPTVLATQTSLTSSNRSRPEFRPNGKLIPRRPRRTIPVTLPSGHPEPPMYPPPPEYYETVRTMEKVQPHPLWQFFHITPSMKEVLPPDLPNPPSTGFGSLEGVDSDPDELVRSGRAWEAKELRNKSFTDLHTLWYVLLKERNVLATQQAERKRLNIPPYMDQELFAERKHRCRKSMARIKVVLNERRLSLIAAAGPSQRYTEPVPEWMDPGGTHRAIRGFNPKTEEKQTYAQRKRRASGTSASGDEGLSTPLKSGGEETVLKDEDVAKEEVESRDEGWGGGNEARDFVEQTEVQDGVVKRKDADP